MKRSHKLLIGLACVFALAITYRAPIVDAAINAVKQLEQRLAAGTQSVAGISQYTGFANWSAAGATTYVVISGALTTDVLTVTPKTATTNERLISAYVYSNNTAVFNLYTGEITSKSWQYTVHRP